MTLKGYIFKIRGCDLFLTDILKANVLIDEDKHARLADFDLLTIMSDTNLISSASFTPGGTWRWMSPELFDPESFGLRLPDEALGLLRIRDGNLRSSEREKTLFPDP